jgi:hypothetical protein
MHSLCHLYVVSIGLKLIDKATLQQHLQYVYIGIGLGRSYPAESVHASYTVSDLETEVLLCNLPVHMHDPGIYCLPLLLILEAIGHHVGLLP